jgi:thiol-disulfide isomerase/thioredoxin
MYDVSFTGPARVLGVMIVTLILGAAGGAHAATEAFTEERFKALQAADALVLVDVHADWCPTCAKQQKVLDAYEAARPAVELHRLLVDFDDQKRWVKHFRAPRQSTLILYRGTEQLWFGVAETRENKLFEAIDEAAGIAR